MLARTPSHLREAEEELLAAGAEDAIGLECDLLDTGEVEAAFTFLDERWGECHALVNTVGPAHVGGLDDLTDAAWLDEFDLGRAHDDPHHPRRRCRCCGRRPSPGW